MKVKHSKFTAACLSAILLIGSLATPVLAADTLGTKMAAGEGLSSEAVLTQEVTRFSVTVPTILPVTVDAQNNVTVATDVSVKNNSIGPVVITGITKTEKGGWSLVETPSQKVGKKEIKFDISTQDSVIAGGQSTLVIYSALTSPQKSTIEAEAALDVVFTVGWDEAAAPETPETPENEYILATDADFMRYSESSPWRYIGAGGYVEIPHTIHGEPVTSYAKMFMRFAGNIDGVKSTNKNITNMSEMFMEGMYTQDLSPDSHLDLSLLDTSNVTNMSDMFSAPMTISVDMPTSSTSKVTNMKGMFEDFQAEVIDLSLFDLSNVTDMTNMLRGALATTGYARTQAEADRLNALPDKPSALTFVVK